jgi:type IV secretory pathway VirB4 component
MHQGIACGSQQVNIAMLYPQNFVLQNQERLIQNLRGR